MDIKGKVVLITGASMGIGETTARFLASKGARVALAARSHDKLEALSKELPGSFPITADMTKTEDIERMINEAKKHYGRIDVLINNAGRAVYGPIETIDPDDYRSILELNVVGVMITMQKIIPLMREQGGGTIVNISSNVSKNYFSNIGAYASTKYALNAISLTARQEVEKDNIVISVLHPMLTATDFQKNAVQPPPQAGAWQRRDLPEADTPELVAEAIIAIIKSGEPELLVGDFKKQLS
jgi:short-subunit dehydrogenase